MNLQVVFNNVDALRVVNCPCLNSRTNRVRR